MRSELAHRAGGPFGLFGSTGVCNTTGYEGLFLIPTAADRGAVRSLGIGHKPPSDLRLGRSGWPEEPPISRKAWDDDDPKGLVVSPYPKSTTSSTNPKLLRTSERIAAKTYGGKWSATAKVGASS